MSKLDVTPSPVSTDGRRAVMERGKGMNYSIEFEVLPTFDLPPYEGMEVEQEKTIVDDAEVEEVVERIRRDRAKLVPVDGDGPAVDGQVANIDFCAYENGQPLEGIKADGFDLALGESRPWKISKTWSRPSSWVAKPKATSPSPKISWPRTWPARP